MTENYHIPALLKETVDGLNIKPDGVYVDVTFGGGGHSKEILSRLGSKGKLFSFDQDEDVLANLIDDERFTFVRSNFKYLKNFMRYHGLMHVDGVLADLGVSFHHFDSADRGFSFRFEGDLDMRMNTKANLTAAKIINEYTEDKLADVLFYYGELRNSRKIASRICHTRQTAPILRVETLLEVLQPFFFREKEKKDMARVFQALRIEVNKEMEVLRSFLSQTSDLLQPGGRLSVLTYHSLEDRLVKNYIKSGNFEGQIEKDFYGNPLTNFKQINSSVIIPSAEEIAQNPRARSAKLRIAEKK